MHRNKSVSSHQFSMIPRADIPRASFRTQSVYKSSFDASYLVPFFCEEVLPGDMFRANFTAFARLATPLFPTMDNLHLETFFFFTPNRLVWTNWEKFMGEQTNPGDSIDFTIPQATCDLEDGYEVGSIQDYFGLPVEGATVDVAPNIIHSALPLRMYNLIYNEWFRDQNLINSKPVPTGNGPDGMANFGLWRRGKRHDYFTSCLPFLQKGDPVTIPIGGEATIRSTGAAIAFRPQTNPTPTSFFLQFPIAGGGLPNEAKWSTDATGNVVDTPAIWGPDGLEIQSMYADLADATQITVNQLRQGFQVQKLLERDARGGTRYTEIIRAHFGVVSPDARLQRPEYLGGGSVHIAINPVAQTSATSADGTDTPQGNLSAIGTGLLRSGFSQSFTEHGYVIGLINVRADLTYQQGIRRHWKRLTRYDYYFPVFAMLGEQAVLTQEIYCTGDADVDPSVFGYQERWAEYRYMPSQVTSLMRSDVANTIDPWHYAQNFTSTPTLNESFINDSTRETLARSLAVGAGANGQQFLLDVFADILAARPMPLYSVPGMVDHF